MLLEQAKCRVDIAAVIEVALPAVIAAAAFVVVIVSLGKLRPVGLGGI